MTDDYKIHELKTYPKAQREMCIMPPAEREEIDRSDWKSPDWFWRDAQ